MFKGWRKYTLFPHLEQTYTQHMFNFLQSIHEYIRIHLDYIKTFMAMELTENLSDVELIECI